MQDCAWRVCGAIDSTKHGDVIGSLCQVGVIGADHLGIFDGPINTPYANTI